MNWDISWGEVTGANRNHFFVISKWDFFNQTMTVGNALAAWGSFSIDKQQSDMI